MGLPLDFPGIPKYSCYLGCPWDFRSTISKTFRVGIEVAWDIVIRSQQTAESIFHTMSDQHSRSWYAWAFAVITPKNFFLRSVASHLYLTISKSPPGWSPRFFWFLIFFLMIYVYIQPCRLWPAEVLACTGFPLNSRYLSLRAMLPVLLGFSKTQNLGHTREFRWGFSPVQDPTSPLIPWSFNKLTFLPPTTLRRL